MFRDPEVSRLMEGYRSKLLLRLLILTNINIFRISRRYTVPRIRFVAQNIRAVQIPITTKKILLD